MSPGQRPQIEEVPIPQRCPICKRDLIQDSDYPNDLLCGNCRKVFDAGTLDFVEAF